MLVFSKLFGESAEKYTRDACAPQKIARTRVIPIESFRVSACTIPTETPEADGTYEWDSTTVVIAEVSGDEKSDLVARMRSLRRES